MSNNRIVQHLELPASEPVVPSLPSGFAICPNPHAQAANPATAASFMHQAAYQQALHEARDREWRAFLDRALFSVWN